jgi:hypothetical protein
LTPGRRNLSFRLANIHVVSPVLDRFAQENEAALSL